MSLGKENWLLFAKKSLDKKCVYFILILQIKGRDIKARYFCIRARTKDMYIDSQGGHFRGLVNRQGDAQLFPKSVFRTCVVFVTSLDLES